MGRKRKKSHPVDEEQLQEQLVEDDEQEEAVESVATTEGEEVLDVNETDIDSEEITATGTEDTKDIKPEAEIEIRLDDEMEAIDTLDEEVESLRHKAEENLNKALRAHAELENVRKRTTRDIENAHKYALEKFIMELLPVLDSMELGISASGNADDITTLREGMDLTLKMFSSTLEKFGIHVIDPQGEKFNPEQHEAAAMQELDDAESGTVISVIQKGYELNGRLVRPAMVIVAK